MIKKVNKKVVVYIVLFLVFLVSGYISSQFVSKKIYANEVQREKNDIEKLEGIKSVIKEAVDSDEDARKWMLARLGNSDYVDIYIGKSEKFEYQVIKEKCTPIYNVIKDHSVNEVRFESVLNARGNNNIKLRIQKDFSVDIKIEDIRGNQIKCNYINYDMRT